MVELKVVEKIRKVLIADATIKGLVSDRVYTEHISSVVNPKLPAISIMFMPSMAKTNVPNMVNMTIQLDLWFPRTTFTVDQVMEAYGNIRTLLHRQNLTDSAIGITIHQILESAIGPIMHDQNLDCRHLPARYSIVGI